MVVAHDDNVARIRDITNFIRNYWGVCDIPNSVGLGNIIITKPTNSPTQGHPNPRQIRLKVVTGPLFPRANNFWWVGNGFYTRSKNKATRNLTQPNSP